MIYSHTERLHIHNQSASSKLAEVIHQLFQPKSVIDVGCGTGNFLSSFKKLGVEEILGIDGEWVDPDLRREFIADEDFLMANLTQPPHIAKRFSLALCLEVGEHLPHSSADVLTEFLTTLSDVVIFSAAVPGQHGPNHVNCEWQNIWGERFSKQGFLVVDLLRPLIWEASDVPWWYRQNIFVAINSNKASLLPKNKPEVGNQILASVHPDFYSIKCDELDAVLQGRWPLRSYMLMLLKSIQRTFHKPWYK